MRDLQKIIASSLALSSLVLSTASWTGPYTPLILLTSDSQDQYIRTDPESASGDLKIDSTVNIGLLIQNNNSAAALHGSELAISIANERGGAGGTPFALVVRSMEGPWGTGSKQAVSMVFDENVAALLGSHDGRNAHLVEQVAAKARVVFISAWSGDPTLSQAFVPWFFNSVFNNNQQSNSIVREICINKRFERIAVVSDDSYDSGSMLKCFMEQIKKQGKADPFQIAYNRESKDIRSVIKSLKSGDFDCLVLFAEPPASMNIIEQMRLNNLQQCVYCPMNQLDENEVPESAVKPYENVIFVSPINFSGKAGISFRDEYRQKFGIYPGAVATCAFDGMNILIEAIRSAGTDRGKLQESIKGNRYEGVTGLIQFDEKGNRMGTPGLVEIKNGIPVQVK